MQPPTRTPVLRFPFQSQPSSGVATSWENEGTIGVAYNRIKDAIERGFRDRLHFVEFQNLTHHPHRTLEEIYEFLEILPFHHDFENVATYTREDDTVHGMPGLHTIRHKVEPVFDDSAHILGPKIKKELTGTEFWRN
jgi:sulfotransferase